MLQYVSFAYNLSQGVAGNVGAMLAYPGQRGIAGRDAASRYRTQREFPIFRANAAKRSIVPADLLEKFLAKHGAGREERLIGK